MFGSPTTGDVIWKPVSGGAIQFTISDALLLAWDSSLLECDVIYISICVVIPVTELVSVQLPFPAFPFFFLDSRLV